MTEGEDASLRQIWSGIPWRTDPSEAYFFCISAIPLGPFPSMGNGDPVIADRPPLELILKTEISFEALHTYTECPEGSATIPVGPLMVPLPPLGNGEPLIVVRAPVKEFRVRADKVASAVLAA